MLLQDGARLGQYEVTAKLPATNAQLVNSVRVGVVLLLTAVLAACGSTDPAALPEVETVAESPDLSQAFVGTWTLARIDRLDQWGAPLPDIVHSHIGHGERLGYLVSDGERLGVVVQVEGRSPIVSTQLTPEEALTALEGYMAYFGPFTVDADGGYIVHHLTGSLNPRDAGTEPQSFFEFSANQLMLTSGLLCPDSFRTDRGCGYGTVGIQLRYVWERLAPTTAEGNGPVDAFLGFWEIDAVERRTADRGGCRRRLSSSVLQRRFP